MIEAEVKDFEENEKGSIINLLFGAATLPTTKTARKKIQKKTKTAK